MTVERVNQDGRFDAPSGWNFDFFKSRSHNNPGTAVKKLHNIRYGYQFNAEAQFNLVVLPGNTEPMDKHFEVIKSINETVSANFWSMDWMGQGGSDRYLADEPRKMHSVDYARDIKDLGRMLHKIRVNNNLPVVIMAHSRGGHLAMRYLAETGKSDIPLITTAPMLDIIIRGFDKTIEEKKKATGNTKKRKAKKNNLKILSEAMGTRFLTSTRRLAYFLNVAKKLGFIKLNSYIPGRKTWRKDFSFKRNNDSTTCEERLRDFHSYEAREENSGLRISDVTYGWLMATADSVSYMKRHKAYGKIKSPVLMFRAGDDTIVKKSAQTAAARQMPQCQLVEVDNARHDLWLETDNVFELLLAKSKEFIEQKVLLVQNTVTQSTPSKEINHERATEVCTPK